MNGNGNNDGKVIVARHGQTNYNSGALGNDERIRGWLDVPLNYNGLVEAKNLADELGNKYKIDDIVSSDLSRARDTANAIRQKYTLPAVMTTTALRPWNLGDMQGGSVKKAIPAMEQFIRQPTEPTPGGEPFNEFKNRYLSFLTKMMSYAQGLGRNVVLTTHTRNQKLTEAWLNAGMKPDFSIDNTTMTNYKDQKHTGSYMVLSPQGENEPWKLHA